MPLKVLHASFTSADHENYHSQTFNKGNLFIASQALGEAAKNIGSEFLSRVEKSFADKKPNTLDSFKNFLSIGAKDNLSINFAAGLLVDSVLYALVHGNACIYFLRSEKFGTLLSKSGSVSGILKPGDIILFTSCELTKIIDPEIVKNSLRLNIPNEIADDLLTKLYSQKNLPAVSGIIISVVNQEEIKKPVTLKTINIASRIKLGLRLPSLVVKPVMKKIRPLAAVILISTLLLVISVFFGIQKQQQDKKSKEVSEVLGTVSHKFEEGMALIDLNPTRARQLLREAQEELAAQKGKSTGKILAEIDEYLKKVESGISAADRSYDISLDSFFDLELVKPNASGNRMSLYQDTLVILDEHNKSIYRISIASKSSRIIASGNDLSQATTLAIHGEDVYVFAGRILKIAVNENSLPLVIEKDDNWGSVKDMKVYAGNIYLLDTGKNWIWKYIREENGFSGRQDYFVFDTLVDLQNADNIAIDGSVWLTKNGQILRFTQGKEDTWQIKGLKDELGSDLDLYLDDTTKNIYLLDKQNKRVVVADKEGMYLSQYRWQEDAKIDDFVVSEVIKKIMLLSGSTIYGIDLK